MFEFFDQIGSFLSSVVDFIVDFFQNLISFFKIVGQAFTFIIQVCNELPVPIKAGCLCIISVAVIYLIIGRS